MSIADLLNLGPSEDEREVFNKMLEITNDGNFFCMNAGPEEFLKIFNYKYSAQEFLEICRSLNSKYPYDFIFKTSQATWNIPEMVNYIQMPLRLNEYNIQINRRPI